MKIFYFRTYAEVHCKKKSRRSQEKSQIISGYWVFGIVDYFVVMSLYSLCGGGGSVRRRNTLHVVGGPTINCHKRGLRGERVFYFIRIK